MLHGAGFFLLQTVIFTNTDNSEKKGLEKEWKTWHNKIDEKHSMKGIKAENGTV